ncbi:MAG TPA: methyltransferase domain-containing protein [Methylomirabilota bacterium]|nr:methyltransferase domain-containing protein [Methylomirabilota bacterium]
MRPPAFSPRKLRSHRLALLLSALVVLAGCATLKQCAYGGLNRSEWQQPERVIQSLDIGPGDHVADLGSGGGYFTFRLAKAVGATGRVYAVDIDPDMTDLLAKQAKQENVGNIEVILAKANDPLLPATGIDLIFTVDTYHHIGNRVSYFANLRKVLRPGGRIAVIDFDRRAWLEGLWHHYTPPEFIKREMEAAGYSLQHEFNFLDRQSFLIFAPRKRS